MGRGAGGGRGGTRAPRPSRSPPRPPTHPPHPPHPPQPPCARLGLCLVPSPVGARHRLQVNGRRVDGPRGLDVRPCTQVPPRARRPGFADVVDGDGGVWGGGWGGGWPMGVGGGWGPASSGPPTPAQTTTHTLPPPTQTIHNHPNPLPPLSPGSLARMPSRISALYGSPAAATRAAASAAPTSSRTKGSLDFMIFCISFLIAGKSASVRGVAVSKS